MKGDEIDDTTNVIRITKRCIESGLIPNGTEQSITIGGNIFYLYTSDFFCPKLPSGEVMLTENTHAIHHFDGSWLGELEKKSLHRKKVLNRVIGIKLGGIVNSVIYNYEKSGVSGILKKLKKKNRKYGL